MLATKSCVIGSETWIKTTGTLLVACWMTVRFMVATATITSGSRPISCAGVPAKIDADVMAFLPSELAQSLDERRDIGLWSRLGRSAVHQHADATYRARLRARRKRPRCRSGEHRDEFAPFHLTELHSLPLARNPRQHIRSSRMKSGDRCAAAF